MIDRKELQDRKFCYKMKFEKRELNLPFSLGRDKDSYACMHA